MMQGFNQHPLTLHVQMYLFGFTDIDIDQDSQSIILFSEEPIIVYVIFDPSQFLSGDSDQDLSNIWMD